MRTITGLVCLIGCFYLSSALAEGPQWCGKNSYSSSHPLAWERFADPVDELVEQKKIREAYALVISALDAEMASLPPSSESRVVKEALAQYLVYILEPGHESPAIFQAGPANPFFTPPTLQYQLGPLGDGAPTAFRLAIPCPALVAGEDPALRNIAHALWSMHKVATHRDFAAALKIASLRSSKLYKDYENYTMNGLPMWPWEMWLNGFIIPDDFNGPAPMRQWVFLRPNLSPAVVTGSDENAGLDFGLTLEIGHVWYRSKDYSSWWGLSAMAALTDDEGTGYGGMLRWNDYTLGVAKHDRNDETLVYVSIDLYQIITGEQSRAAASQLFLDALVNTATTAQ